MDFTDLPVIEERRVCNRTLNVCYVFALNCSLIAISALMFCKFTC